ncbi:flavoprotein [Streptomyces sp. NPDC045251]|uniref:flavoprotein n=1 Tax=unclassified Streptomyces TaxID=2593676 RepID=UPI0033DE94CE
MSEQTRKPFLYVVVCAAGVASGVGELITAAHERDWAVGVFATPVALNGFDTTAVEAQTGRPVRSAWRRPGDPRPFPAPDAVVVAPAPFNTVNKWAAGIADNLALATLCEACGLRACPAAHAADAGPGAPICGVVVGCRLPHARLRSRGGTPIASTPSSALQLDAPGPAHLH